MNVYRHWELIGQANGGPIQRSPETSLSDMIDIGLHRIVPQLEEIGSTASKEYALEMTLAKMKAEWRAIVFESHPYRESGET